MSQSASTGRVRLAMLAVAASSVLLGCGPQDPAVEGQGPEFLTGNDTPPCALCGTAVPEVAQEVLGETIIPAQYLAPPADFAGVDLGLVVSSGVDPNDPTPPPPDFNR